MKRGYGKIEGYNYGTKAFSKCSCGHLKFQHEYDPYKINNCFGLCKKCACKKFNKKDRVLKKNNFLCKFCGHHRQLHDNESGCLGIIGHDKNPLKVIICSCLEYFSNFEKKRVDRV